MEPKVDRVRVGSADLVRYQWSDGIGALFIGNETTRDDFLVAGPSITGFLRVGVAWQDIAQMSPDHRFGDLLRNEIETAIANHAKMAAKVLG